MNHGQLELGIIPVIQLKHSRLQRRFESFHRENEHVLDEIIKIARDLKRHGFKKTGMKLIFERLRWLHALKTKGDDEYKLNNNHTAFYARVVMLLCPDLDSFFRTREQGIEYIPNWEALRIKRPECNG